MGFWRFAHLAGFVLWLGGACAVMAMGIRGRRETRAGLGAVVRAQGAVTAWLVGPGALLTVFSGLVLTMRVMGMMSQYVAGASLLYLMQGAGVLGGLVVLFVQVPTAARLARLDPEGQYAAAFDALRRRLAIAGSVAGTLGLVALAGGAWLRG